jgi:multiple sugar transport system permease protein
MLPRLRVNRVAGSASFPAEAAPGAERGVRVIAYEPAAFNARRPVHLHLYLMLPAIIVLASISLYPFFWLIYMSLHEVQLAPNRPDTWVGLANFARLLSD